jgi:hypothetical protein
MLASETFTGLTLLSAETLQESEAGEKSLARRA